MLSPPVIASIKQASLEYWKSEVRKPAIIEIAKGKEIGHKVADLVDEKTSALLTLNYITKREHNSAGKARSRSMGDLWLQDNDIYHPVNVKTGIVGSEGQPNLVSLKKVLRAVMSRHIDSYYLLYVKLQISPQEIVPTVHLVDMLDCMDYVTFDSGPGQMMLKAVKFFTGCDPDTLPSLSIREKAQRLMDLLEDGEKRLKVNREKDLDRVRKSFMAFMEQGEFAVTQFTQRGLHLV
ncbi:MAG: hypothetical protein ACLQNE_37140 [Thermoguttaceae bacterium]